ncbi:EthD family reductase [Bacillus dakarensis]|uniref:EthD family reductase n=1 Tax=Robertmurraya dakarensis TaxID=1926278 RepID=UPI0009823A75|nr:EthD family reductase [Bacillus dakarensis]
MAKLIVMYEEPKDKDGFEKHYHDVHIPLVRKMPNIREVAVQRVLQTQNSDVNYYLVAELIFEDMETLSKAFASPDAQAAQNDMANLLPFLNKPPVTAILD